MICNTNQKVHGSVTLGGRGRRVGAVHKQPSHNCTKERLKFKNEKQYIAENAHRFDSNKISAGLASNQSASHVI